MTGVQTCALPISLYPDRSYPRPVLWLLLLGGVALLGLAAWLPRKREAPGRQVALAPVGPVRRLVDGLHGARQGALDALDRSLSAVYRHAGALTARLTGLLVGARGYYSIPDGVRDAVAAPGRLWHSFAPYGRESERGSWLAFAVMLLFLLWIGWSLPSVTAFSKSMQVARLVVLVSIFGLMAFSLNLHTGFTGMTNFGVIFFVGLGGITVALVPVSSPTSPSQTHPPLSISRGSSIDSTLTAMLTRLLRGVNSSTLIGCAETGLHITVETHPFTHNSIISKKGKSHNHH